MRILVCGGRDFDDWKLLSETLDDIMNDILHEKGDDEPIVIIHGDAKGADFLARVWAKDWMKTIDNVSSDEYIANWKQYGKSAGPIRNFQMVEEGNPDLVVAFEGGKGTVNMINVAKAAGIEVREVQ